MSWATTSLSMSKPLGGTSDFLPLSTFWGSLTLAQPHHITPTGTFLNLQDNF